MRAWARRASDLSRGRRTTVPRRGSGFEAALGDTSPSIVCRWPERTPPMPRRSVFARSASRRPDARPLPAATIPGTATMPASYVSCPMASIPSRRPCWTLKSPLVPNPPDRACTVQTDTQLAATRVTSRSARGRRPCRTDRSSALPRSPGSGGVPNARRCLPPRVSTTVLVRAHCAGKTTLTTLEGAVGRANRGRAGAPETNGDGLWVAANARGA